MNRVIRHVAPWLAAAIGGALVFAPVASADSSADSASHVSPSPSDSQGAQAQCGADPFVPYGSPVVPYGSDLSTDEPYDLAPYIDNPWIFPPPDGSFHRCG